MITHVVLLKLKPRTTEEQASAALKRIEDLRNVIPEISDVTLGANLNTSQAYCGYTHGFVMHFENESALKVYAENPTHQEAGAGLVAISESIIDFDLQS
ncbi:Dabb family protein [Ktedonobacter racemifer]|uniref:Stress responsive alpha-beta barrel domain protein n=1 Tax=Ktedonobacter racemifer DSM 44963 TaxID=485913 RepID=D6TVH0_KTERA|nr:Dabb family protein [Ktedonobacter racemifer]EFH85373.1 Stress responsive alpha-beta barrel domain protein [Ktedonobacter racemifer DSM 44963]